MPIQYLIKGDLSGIQKFIFNVLSDGAARSIRGRSFFLKIVLEVAMKAIFDELEINEESEIERAKISTSGGNFILMVNQDPKDALKQIEAQFREAFQFIDINLILAYTEYKQGDYTASIEQLDKNTREKKFKLLQNTQIQYFEPFEHNSIKVNKNDKWSEIIGDFFIDSEVDSWDIHSNLSRGNNVTFGEKRISLIKYDVLFKKEGKYKLKNYLESYNPLKPDKKQNKKTFKTFEDFARDGMGVQKLGVLAMDVDNLGSYFNYISSPEEHKQFDRELNSFFNVRLRELIERNYDQKVYPVTAGGDDSYFVGHWSIMLNLAQLIKKEFEIAFKNRNEEINKIIEANKDANIKKLTISAAMIIVKPKFPVVRFVDLVDADLKKAKYDYPNSKENISLFGEVVKWEFLEKDIMNLRKSFKLDLSAGLLAKARLTARDIAENNTMKLSDYWKMDYFLRNYAQKNKQHYDEISKEFKGNLVKSAEELNKLSSTSNADLIKLRAKNYRLIFPIAARLAELDNRKNR